MGSAAVTRPKAVRVFAPAKINLFLHVGARRADGYHELQSLVVFADAGDELLIEPASELSLKVEGPFAAALANEPDNLVLRAAHALARKVGIEPKARITLTKNLPVASGIGGGSADAAAALRGLREFWKVTLDDAALNDIALELGSDVPVCLLGEPAMMEGRGERVTPVSGVAPLALVLVHPGVAVSTADVFHRLVLSPAARKGWIKGPSTSGNVLDHLAATRNDLEVPARNIAPAIDNVLSSLSNAGATLARMSGSGATCFGLFEDAASANAAAQTIQHAHRDWWVRAAKTVGSDIGKPRPA